jgi:hypothetical protein
LHFFGDEEKAKMLDSAHGRLQKTNHRPCAAFIAAPRLMFLDQDSAPALRAVLSDSVWKAELLLEHIDARGPNRNATRPAAKTDPYFDLKNELHAGPPPSVKNGPKPETKNEPTPKIVAPR